MSDLERVIHAPSPDGAFSIEQSWRFDDRAPEWQRTRILAQPSGRVLADLPLFELAADPEFAGSGRVRLPLRHRYGRRLEVAVDVAAGTFTLEPTEVARPLGQLAACLAEVTAPPKPASPTPASRGMAVDLVSAIGGSMFVAAGVLLMLISASDERRRMGLVGIAFFGTCAVVPMLGLQRRWPRLAPHLPLLAAAAEIPWTIGLLALHLLADGSRTSSRAQTSALTAVAIVPAMFGFLWALVAAAHRPALCPTARHSLAFGGLICAAIIGWFIWQAYG